MDRIIKNPLYFFFFVVRCLTKSLFNFHEVSVLMYHSISKSNWIFSVEPKNFERQMRYLKEKGFKVVSLDKVFEFVQGKRNLPKKTVAITFDDGYRDIYQNAFPVLKKYRFPATVFYITRARNNGNLGNSFKLFNWKEAREMLKGGLIKIESHSDSHSDLKKISINQIGKEIILSKKKIKKNLGSSSYYYFAFPGGRFNQIIIDILRKENFKAAFTIDEGLVHKGDDAFRLKRISVDRSISLWQFRIRLTKAIDWYANLKRFLKAK